MLRRHLLISLLAIGLPLFLLSYVVLGFLLEQVSGVRSNYAVVEMGFDRKVWTLLNYFRSRVGRGGVVIDSLSGDSRKNNRLVVELMLKPWNTLMNVLYVLFGKEWIGVRVQVIN